MGYATLQKETATPATPNSGFVRFYAEGSSLKYRDDTGTIYTIATGLTQEDVQDIVAGLIVDSSTVTWTYTDASDTLAATVVAGAVNHNALLNYVANQHVDHSTVSVSAGTGLTGGGTIAVNRTIALANTTVAAGSYGSASSVPNYTVNAQGQLTAAASTAIAVTSAAVSDFAEAVDDRVAALVVAGTGITATYNDPANTLTLATTITQYTDEQAQDAVGAALLDTASVDLVYNDAANQISATVLPAGVNHDALQNFVAAEHVNHTAVSITAGTGLTGGGDISATRSLAIANTAVTAGSYGSANNIPVLTINAQGQVTAATTVANPATIGITAAKTTAALNSTSNAVLTNVSELALTVTATNTYKIECYLLYRSAAAGTGIVLSFGNTSAAGTIAIASITQVGNDGTGAGFYGHVTSFGDVVISTGVQTANVDYVSRLEGVFVCTTGGTITPQFRSETNGTQVTVQPGSVILSREI